MNKQRRANLEKIQGLIEDSKEQLENEMNDEQEYFDNMPESLQGGEKGSMAEEAVRAMETAIENLDSAIESISEASN